MLTNLIKKEIINALKTDGFNVTEKKDFVVATKKENILYIRSLEDIHTELNLKYITEKSTLKKISGVDVLELKKLINEARNKQIINILEFVTNKLNWSITFSDTAFINKKEIEFIEVYTDRSETITLVFLDRTRYDHFFALEMSQRKFVKLLDENLHYKDLQSFAPNLYKLVVDFK